MIFLFLTMITSSAGNIQIDHHIVDLLMVNDVMKEALNEVNDCDKLMAASHVEDDEDCNVQVSDEMMVKELVDRQHDC